MRNILLVAVGALVIGSGCAAHDAAWKVRTADHWPVQTWDAEAVVAAQQRDRCTTPLQTTRRLWNPSYCCDPPLSLNSYGPRADLCLGRRHTETISYSPPVPPPPMPQPTPSSLASHTTTFHGGPRSR